MHTAAGRQRVEQDVDEALGQLADASLLTFSGDGSTVSAHRLIKRVARERRAYDGTLAAIGARTCELLSAVTRSLNQPWQNRATARDTIQQVIAMNDHLSPYLGDDHAAVAEELLGLRRWALWCMNDLGDSTIQAIEYGKPVVAECERVLGDTHPDTLTSRNNLAYAYREASLPSPIVPDPGKTSG
jgi:hypothetical protein